MSFLLGILIVAKGIALVSGLFILSGGNGKVEITPPQITRMDSVLVLSTQVNQPLSSEIRELLKTGVGIPLELTLDFYRLPEPGALDDTSATRIFSMDLVSEKYYVIQENDPRDTLWAKDLKEGLQTHGRFKDLFLARVSQIQKESQYQIVITARLKKINMKALGGQELDLMKFWNYKAAELKTEPFYGKDLIQ